MNSSKKQRGLGTSFIVILVLLGIAVWIGSMRHTETGYNWSNFSKDLSEGKITSAVIAPNAEVPTGVVTFI